MADDPKKYSFDRDALIISAFAFAFGALFAWALIDPPLIQKAAKAAANSKPSEWPAWVQAVGSIAAILVAIAVPYTQRRTELQETRRADILRARSLGAALLRDIKRFRDQLERARDSGNRAQMFDTLNVSPEMIPTPLWMHVDRLHELGDPGSDLIAAIGIHHQALDLAGGGFLMPEEIRPYLRLIEAALTHCKKSVHGIEQML